MLLACLSARYLLAMSLASSNVVSISEPVDESPTGRMLEGIIEVLDEFYSANLAQEVTRGMREAASRGYWVASRVPYGYRPVKVQDGDKHRVKLEPEPDTAKVVRQVFGLALSGKGVKEIVKELNLEDIPSPRGKRWGKSQVYSILVNEVYRGTLVWGVQGNYHGNSRLQPVRVEGTFPAIIDATTFQRVQAALRSRAPSKMPPRRAGSPYLLSGLLRCGKCGAAMFGVGAKSGRFHYYVCATAYRTGKESCPEKAVSQQLVEGQVVGKVGGLILKEEHLAELVRLTNEELERSLLQLRERVERVDAQITETEGRLERLYDALETGKIDLDDLAPRIKELKEKRDLLQRARAEARETLSAGRVELISRELVLEYLKDLRGVLEYGSVSEKRAFLRSFIQAIEKDGSQVTMYYTLPLPAEQVPLDPVGVLGTVHDGGAGGTRTPYLFNAIEALSQLSYSPTLLGVAMVCRGGTNKIYQILTGAARQPGPRGYGPAGLHGSLASTRPQAAAAPASLSARAQADSVLPVVQTSSTSSTRRPEASPGHWKAPWTLRARSSWLAMDTCGGVGLVRRSRPGATGRPSLLPTSRASNSDWL